MLVKRIELPHAEEDEEEGITVTMDTLMDPKDFIAVVRDLISEWKLKGKKVLRIKLGTVCSNLVYPALQEGFIYHGADSEHLMLVKRIQLPNANKDHYDGVTVTMDEPMDPEAFLAALRDSISEWKLEGKKGVWIKLLTVCSNLVHPALQEGFEYHHAEKEYLMLVKWLPDPRVEPSTIPQNASHRVGVGAFVLNEKREVLVVREKTGRLAATGVWKFVTGVVKEGEDISDAVIREVEEETGIKTELKEILAFRQSHQAFHTKSDLLFICMLEPKTFEIKKQDVEIEAAKWMPIDEYIQQPFNQRNGQFKHTAEICLERSKQPPMTSGFTPTRVIAGRGKEIDIYSGKK